MKKDFKFGLFAVVMNGAIKADKIRFPEELIINESIPGYNTEAEIQKLLQNKERLDVNCLNDFGHTPLSTACYVGSLRYVKLLLELGADICLQDTDGWSPLHFAVATKHYDIAKLLLNSGADMSQVTNDGQKPLDFIKDKKIRIALTKYSEMCVMSTMRTSHC